MNIERLKKIRALALNGCDGEQETAKKLFEQLSKKYGIDSDDFDEDQINSFNFKFSGKEERVLLVQTIYKVTDRSDNIWIVKYTKSGKRCRTLLGTECTAAQKTEIEFLFEFYRRVWQQEKSIFMNAFIQKHKIFGHLKNGEDGTEYDVEDYEKIYNFMKGMSDEEPLRQLNA